MILESLFPVGLLRQEPWDCLAFCENALAFWEQNTSTRTKNTLKAGRLRLSNILCCALGRKEVNKAGEEWARYLKPPGFPAYFLRQKI